MYVGSMLAVFIVAIAINLVRGTPIGCGCFTSLEDARAWADADPYVEAGVYGEVTVKPFKKVFPN